MDKIRIALTDDHDLVRDGIKALISESERLQIVGEFSSAKALLEDLKHIQADLLLLDISMPEMSGLELCKILQEEQSAVKIIICSMYTDEDFIRQALKYNVKGYLPKNTDKSELLKAIFAVAEGKNYFTDEISEIMLKGYIRQVQADSQPDKLRLLSKREKEVLILFAEGALNSEIADQLNISIRTVESHKNNLMNKLKLKSGIELVKFALKNKLIEL